MTDTLAERVRKLGFATIHSIGQIASLLPKHNAMRTESAMRLVT